MRLLYAVWFVGSRQPAQVRVEECDGVLDEQLVARALKGVGLAVVGHTFDRFIQCLQSRAQVRRPLRRHYWVGTAVMDAHRYADALQMIDR